MADPLSVPDGPPVELLAPPDWDSLPRMLFELCDGHPARGQTVYAFDGYGHRCWLCTRCWLDAWRKVNEVHRG